MDSSQDMEDEEFVSNKEMMLPSLINLNESCILQERVHSIKMLMKFSSSCELSEIDETLMQFVMPALKNSLLEVFDKNTSMLKNAPEKENIPYDTKENLQIAISLFHICDDIMNFVNELGTVQYYHIQSIPQNLSEMILSSFQHCKLSQEFYLLDKDTNVGIIQLFRKTQEVHIKFLKWFEGHLILDEESTNMLCSVLSIIVVMAEVLLNMNLKLMVDNWKSFTAITQKYADLLNRKGFDLSQPLKTLNESIQAKLDEVLELEVEDIKQIHQTMKFVNFLIKVTLKLCEVFFSQISKVCREVLEFCFVVYSYSPLYFISSQYPPTLINLVESVCENRKTFVTQLLEEYCLSMILLIEEVRPVILWNTFGSVELLVDILDALINTFPNNFAVSKDLEWARVIQCTFEIVKLSPADLYLSEKLYEDFVVNISIIILMTSGKSFTSIEKILMQNILQEEFWPAVLAMDVWCLVLRNSSLATCLESTTYLLKQVMKMDSIVFTWRPELVHLRILSWRIYQLVPTSRTFDILSNFKPPTHLNFWQAVEFGSIAASQRCFLEPLFIEIYQLNDRIPNVTPPEFIRLMKILDAISTLHPNSFGLHVAKICQVVTDLWNFTLSSPTNTGNNFVKYFMRKLCAITQLFLQHFNGSMLLNVLNQLKQVSVCPEYKVLIIEHLNGLSFKNIENCLEKNNILAEIASLLELLLRDSNPVIRQLALQECYSFIKNSPDDQITNSVIRNLRSTQYDVNPFLQKTPVASLSSKLKYIQVLEDIKFEHQCIAWSESVVMPRTERPVLSSISVKSIGELPVKQKKVESSVSSHQNKKLKADFEPSGNDYCEIDSLISSIKSEMKSLAKAAKKETMTQKNVSDINYIITQLHSIAQK